MGKKRRVVAYARVSTDSEDQRNSYDNQKRYFERIIKANESYEFIGIYADRGLSGTKLYRPEFDRLLNDAGLKRVVDEETGKPVDAYVIVNKPIIDLIYVKDITRFARNVSADALLKTLAMNKVYVIYVTIDGVEHTTETVDGIPFMQGALQAAEQFSRDISSKVKFGMKEGAYNGNIFIGKQLYGYNYIPHPENRLEIIEEEAEVVRLIFDLYVNENMGTERIARELGAREIFTRRGKRFSSTTLLSMLKNEKYYGMNDGMKYYTGDLFGDRRLQNVPIEKQFRFETDKIPAIISKEIFDKATDIRENRTSHKQNKGRYLGKTDYAGIVICGKCGTSYQACGTSKTKTKVTRYFACRCKYRYDTENGIPKCDNPTIRQDSLDELLTSTSYSFRRWTRVRNGLKELKRIRDILESRIDRDNELEILEVEKQIAEINEKKGKLLDLYIDDIFSKEQLDERVQPLETALKEQEERLRLLSKTNEDLFNDISEINDIILVFEEENKILQDEANNGNIASKYSRKELLRDIDNIVVSEDGSLTLNFKSLSIINKLTLKYRYLLEKVS